MALRASIVTAAYVAAMMFVIYALIEPSVGYGSDAFDIALVVALAVLHIATGWLLGRPWAVLLPFVIIPLAIPAGTPDRGEDPLPIWVPLTWAVAPLGAVVIGVAVALRRLRAGMSESAAQSTGGRGENR